MAFNEHFNQNRAFSEFSSKSAQAVYPVAYLLSHLRTAGDDYHGFLLSGETATGEAALFWTASWPKLDIQPTVSVSVDDDAGVVTIKARYTIINNGTDAITVKSGVLAERVKSVVDDTLHHVGIIDIPAKSPITIPGNGGFGKAEFEIVAKYRPDTPVHSREYYDQYCYTVFSGNAPVAAYPLGYVLNRSRPDYKTDNGVRFRISDGSGGQVDLLSSTHNFSVSINVTETKGDGHTTLTAKYTVTNNGSEDFTITHANLIKYAPLATTGKNGHIVASTIELPTPITVPAGGGYNQVTLTIKCTYAV